MSNPYQEPVEASPIAKRGLTWAEWSIIVAVLLWMCAGLYAWSAQRSAASARAEATVAQEEQVRAKEELARLTGTSPEDIQQYLDQIRTLSSDTQRLQTELTRLRADLTRWQNYANELDRFVDAEIRRYWTNPSSLRDRPARPR